MEWLILLGLFAGALTTLAGLGGGMLMTLALAALGSPSRALAAAAPALLIGNAHRVALYRRALDRSIWVPLVVGAAPGALVGALVAVSLPDSILRVLLVAGAALAVAKKLGWLPMLERTSRKYSAPVSFGAGVLTATSGGGGLLLGPLLLTMGVSGERFVATASLVASSMHIARIVGYGAGGLVTQETLVESAVLAASILAGNLLGKAFRPMLSDQGGQRLTYSVLLLCVALSVLGLR
ncbi:MAG: sulfite exporter TauE/SafE family protein [Myxococcota bacterium]